MSGNAYVYVRPRRRHVGAEAGRQRAVQLHRAQRRLRLVRSADPQALAHGFDHRPEAEAGVRAGDVDADAPLVERIDDLLRIEALGLQAVHRRSNQVAGHADRDGPEAERGAQREVERRHRSLDEVPALHAVGREGKRRIVREPRVLVPVDAPAERDIERAAEREPTDPGRGGQRGRGEQIGEPRLPGIRAFGAGRRGQLGRRLRVEPAPAAHRQHAADVEARAVAERDARRVEVERRRVGRDDVALLAAELRRGEPRREGRGGGC